LQPPGGPITFETIIASRTLRVDGKRPYVRAFRHHPGS